ncbi:MAG: alpha amylase C-terminal domain-containing protein, partial [Oscillospiraceae bacterium]|nr:alpha amylase C-terminal domain-containing protein [Oscillospiraceae bacterium]
MLYLNFGVDDPRLKKFNRYGDEGDLDAIEYIRGLNKSMGVHHPDVMMMAEESTAWPLVTYPPEDGGLGFNYKWNMGWMHDTLHYMQADFPYRPGAHHLLTFSMMYAFSENFVLALSHDEVVHGKCSIIGRMPGDYWRQFAGMRVLYLYQITHPGAKLNFMGSEFAQFIEWREYEGLQWFLPDNYTAHKAQLDYVKALNHVYTKEKALWQVDTSWDGYTWLDADNNKQSMLAFIRKGKRQADDLVVVINFCPETYQDYRVGVPRKGDWQVIFNSDDPQWGGSGIHSTPGILKSEKEPYHGQKNSVTVNIPPIGGIILKRIPTLKATAPKKKD